MTLLTEGIRSQLPALGKADVLDPVLHTRFYMPDCGLTWFAAEGEPEGERHGSDFIFYGYSVGAPAWGRFKLSELLGAQLPVERDLEFDPTRFSRLPSRYRPVLTAR